MRVPLLYTTNRSCGTALDVTARGTPCPTPPHLPTGRTVTRGSWFACAGIVVCVFFSGLCGLLAAWASSGPDGGANLITANTNPNLYFFSVSSSLGT